jgi:predicted hydrocarbon binding protein
MTELPPIDIIGKLMITRELSFGNGRISLFGSRVVLPPARIFSEYIRMTNNSPEAAHLLYEAARISFGEGMGPALGRKFRFSVNDFFNWLPNIGALAGWGKITAKEFIAEKSYGVVLLEDSPIVSDLKGAVKGPVDHVLAGFINGAAEATLRTAVETKEEECAVEGAAMCKFVFHPAKSQINAPI